MVRENREKGFFKKKSQEKPGKVIEDWKKSWKSGKKFDWCPFLPILKIALF